MVRKTFAQLVLTVTTLGMLAGCETVPTSPDAQYAAVQGNSFAWRLTNFALLPAEGGIYWLAVDPNDVLFAVVGCGSQREASCGQGVFRSVNQGQTWTQQNSGLTSVNIVAIASTPAGHLFVAANEAGAFRSVDGGNSWQPTALTDPHLTEIFATPDGAVYALDGFFCTGLFRTDDDGASWVALNDGLATCVNGFAASPTGDTLYVATGTSGVFRSTDRGASWSAMNTGFSTFDFSWAVTTPPSYVFVQATGQGEYRSTDKAATWTAVNSGLPSDVGRISANASNHLIVGTGSGVFRSTDNGTSWQAVNTGLPTPLPALGPAAVFESSGRAVISDGTTIWRSKTPF